MEQSDKTGAAMLFEQHLLEQMLRVQQPPKMFKAFAVPAVGGENRLLSEQIGRFIKSCQKQKPFP